MKKVLLRVATVLGGLLTTTMAFAQEGAAQASNGIPGSWIPLGAGLAIGIAAAGAATAQGRATGAALEGIARNPSAKDALFQPFILGLVFMEFQALLGFVVAIIWTFK